MAHIEGKKLYIEKFTNEVTLFIEICLVTNMSVEFTRHSDIVTHALGTWFECSCDDNELALKYIKENS